MIFGVAIAAVVYFILSRLLYLANLGQLCMPHPDI